jgi:hypothetical protein
MYQKTCEGCGRRFEAQKPNRKWCDNVCGRRARRKAQREFPPVARVLQLPASDDGDLPLVDAVRAELDARGMAGSASGVHALMLADRMAQAQTPSGVAALSRELNRVLVELRRVPVPARPLHERLDELAARRPRSS